MIRRPPRSTPLYSSAASDVYKRQTLLVTPLSMGPHAAPRTVDRDLDLASSGIRSGDHIDIIPAAAAAGLTGPRAVATVTVVEGPDVGKTFPLGAGSHTIGRGHDASVRLSDG